MPSSFGLNLGQKKCKKIGSDGSILQKVWYKGWMLEIMEGYEEKKAARRNRKFVKDFFRSVWEETWNLKMSYEGQRRRNGKTHLLRRAVFRTEDDYKFFDFGGRKDTDAWRIHNLFWVLVEGFLREEGKQIVLHRLTRRSYINWLRKHGLKDSKGHRWVFREWSLLGKPFQQRVKERCAKIFRKPKDYRILPTPLIQVLVNLEYLEHRGCSPDRRIRKRAPGDCLRLRTRGSVQVKTWYAN